MALDVATDEVSQLTYNLLSSQTVSIKHKCLFCNFVYTSTIRQTLTLVCSICEQHCGELDASLALQHQAVDHQTSMCKILQEQSVTSEQTRSSLQGVHNMVLHNIRFYRSNTCFCVLETQNK